MLLLIRFEIRTERSCCYETPSSCR